jgi:hypothetical protein
LARYDLTRVAIAQENALQSKATTVNEYLTSLPDDRRVAVEAVRKVILANLDRDYAEGMSYGMIGYFVPHKVFPAGYHCDPKQPLPFAGLASQKNYLSLYLMGVYCGCGEGPDAVETTHARWFREAWAKTGKKLDMGKACVRFKKVEDLALDVIGEAIRRVPAQTYIAQYQQVLAAQGKAPKVKAAPAKVAPTKIAGKAATPAKKAMQAKSKTTSRKGTK